MLIRKNVQSLRWHLSSPGRIPQEYRRNLLTGAQIGIWSIIRQEGKEPVMEADANMRELLGLTKGTTSEECYRIWRDNIPSEYTEKVDKLCERNFGKRIC